MNIVKPSQSTMLYDIPNFVYQRTQMHFPQAEESWLNMAAEGKIGDDVKPEKILNNLNGIISEARTHALTENYEARVKAKKDAMDENYSEYDVHKGKVIHKIYGKQVGGTMTLKPEGVQGQMLAQTSAPKMKSFGVVVPQGLKEGQKFIAQIAGHGQVLVTVPHGVKAGQEVAISVPSASSKAAPKPVFKKQATASAPKKVVVVVPKGLKAGQKFIAQVAGQQELVTVPAGVHGGQEVVIGVPAAKKHAQATHAHAHSVAPAVKHPQARHLQKVFQESRQIAARRAAVKKNAHALPHVGPLPHIRTSHHFADEMADAGIMAHYNSVNHKVWEKKMRVESQIKYAVTRATAILAKTEKK